ncbi:tail fiber protein [Jatrophihabitans sp.]|uniref:phage tail protein n=1 Tax=Jatrophihabitans sp. TaxID=1932789 RepID=UPI0030C713D5|nr:phage tail protein [Jatrophihabitans sp.]
MTDQFIGEIRMFAGNFAPNGWALCNGQLLAISQNTALFSLLGTYYGGDGRSTFALPNLQGTTPIDMGSGAGLTPRSLGESGGLDAVTIAASTLPAHTHQAAGVAAAGTTPTPAGGAWAEPRAQVYGSGSAVSLATDALATAGSSQPHNNLAPYLVVNFIIALQGIFPARN